MKYPTSFDGGIVWREGELHDTGLPYLPAIIVEQVPGGKMILLRDPVSCAPVTSYPHYSFEEGMYVLEKEIKNYRASRTVETEKLIFEARVDYLLRQSSELRKLILAQLSEPEKEMLVTALVKRRLTGR